jgi:hypothetical protein
MRTKTSIHSVAETIEEKRSKANRKEFRRILRRKGGELPDEATGVDRFAK